MCRALAARPRRHRLQESYSQKKRTSGQFDRRTSSSTHYDVKTPLFSVTLLYVYRKCHLLSIRSFISLF